MGLCLDSHGSYAEAIATRLTSDIQTQKLRSGARLQPLRKLADKYDASYLTMRKAVNLLCEKGVLSSKQGSGVYVNGESSQSSSSQAKTQKKTVTVIFSGMEKFSVEQGVYSKFLYGIEKEAVRQGFQVVISLLRNAEEFRGTDTYANSCGFLLIGDDVDGLQQIFKGKPVVWAMGVSKKWGDHISYNNRDIGVIAAEEFIAKGHKHLACINVHEGHGDERCRAFKEHAEALGTKAIYFNNPEALKYTHFEQHIEYSILESWVNQIENANPRPTAVFVVDLVAQPLCAMLVERGIKPGRDIEIATCHWRKTTSTGGQYHPINIDQHPDKIGMLAVRQLQWRFDNPDEDRVVMKIEPEIEKQIDE